MQDEPTVDFSFCLGADTFLDVTEWKWKRSQDVVRLLQGRFVVVPRTGIDRNQVHERQRLVNQDYNGHVVVLDVDHLNEVSSSLVRSCRDPTQLATMLAPGVLEYIQQHRLYAFADDSEVDTS